MFLKLVKHELHETYRLLLLLFAGLLVMAGLARGSIWIMDLSNNAALKILGVMLIGIFVLSRVATVILTVVLMMVRFARSVHGDEGYLTHTLPVGTHSILLSRLLVSFLAVLSSYAAVYLGFRICTAGVKSVSEIGTVFRLSMQELDIDPGRGLLKFGVMILVSSLTQILQIFAAISIGHSFNTGKTGKSVLFYFVLSIGSSLVTNLLSLVVMGSQFLSQSQASLSQLTELATYFSLGADLILAGVYYFLTWIMTRKRLNLA